jgi:hypothetical protein
MTEIHRKDEEIKKLRDQLAKQAKNLDEIQVLKETLDAKQEEIRQLEDKVVELKQKQVPLVRPPLGVDSKQISDAIQQVRPSIQFCADELSSRRDITTGAPKNGDIDAVVRLTTTPAGKPYDLRTAGLEYSPSVKQCMQDALARVQYPKGTETLDIAIYIAYSDGNLAMTGRVVGQHEGRSSTSIDM